MPYSFSPAINTFVITSLFDSIRQARPSNRQPSTSYSVGTQVTIGSTRYIAIQGGTTGTGAGPSGNSGQFNDGTVRWLALGQESVFEGNIISNIYLGVGKQTEWANPANPPAPDVSLNGQTQALKDLTALVKLNPENFRLGFKANAYESGTVYSQYNPAINQSSYTGPHYSVVNGRNVYKVIDNNGGSESVDAPSGTSSLNIETPDGYIWRFVGTVASSEQFDFGTSEFLPLPANSTVAQAAGEISTFDHMVATPIPFDEDDALTVGIIGTGANASAVPRTNTSGQNKSITGFFAASGGSGYGADSFVLAWKSGLTGSGSLLNTTVTGGEVSAITVQAAGSGYASASVIIIGDGEGATATATVSNGSITNIQITNAGDDYTWARAFVIPGTQGAVARAVLSPESGHGSDLATELNASTLLISAKLSPATNAYVPTEPDDQDGSFRQISLVSGVQAATGSERNAIAYVGPANTKYSSPGSLNKYREGSGYVLYVNNLSAITHTTSQEEVIKISISL